MDPDAALIELRDRVNCTFDLAMLQDAFNALDEWLCDGGFLPKDWEYRNGS